MDAQITITDVAAFEVEKERVENALAAMAREIYEIRKGHELGKHEWLPGRLVNRSYCFESFDRYDGDITVSFFHSDQCGGDTEVVRFPEGYLGLMNWRQIERDIRAEKEACAVISKFANAIRLSINRLARERRDYARLKARLGPGA